MTRNAKNRYKSNKTGAKSTVEVRSKDICSKSAVYGDKKVFLSIINRNKPVSWLKVDPNYSGGGGEHGGGGEEIDGCFALTRMPGKMNTPPTDLDVYRLIVLKTPIFNSEVYIVGGRYLDYDGFLCYGKFTDEHEWYCSNKIDRPPYRFLSDKVFTYHLVSDEWKELSCKLNIARGLAHVVIAAGVAYIIGGIIIDYCHHIKNKKHWIECFNLLGNKKKKKKNATWEFLPTAPPDAVFKDYFPLCTFVYEHANMIVFVMREAGCYAYNYVSKTWAPFLQNINITEHISERWLKVSVIDHLLFWHHLGNIYAYDLKNDQLVLSHHLDQLMMGKDVDKPISWAESFLERVGSDTLLLICWNFDDNTGKEIHFYKFRIQNYSAQASYENLGLAQIGFGRFSSSFSSSDTVIHDVVAV